MDFSREGLTIITKAIENTILTDYLACVQKEAKEYIRIFSACRQYLYPESLHMGEMLAWTWDCIDITPESIEGG